MHLGRRQGCGVAFSVMGKQSITAVLRESSGCRKRFTNTYLCIAEVGGLVLLVEH